MRRIGILGAALLALVAIGALGANSALAKTKNLGLYTELEGNVLEGQPVEAAGIIEFYVPTTHEPVSVCRGAFEGEDLTNFGPTDTFVINEAGGGIAGEGTCEGAASVTASGFRWSLTFGANGKASLVGNIVFTIDAACVYTAKKLTGANTKTGAIVTVLKGGLTTKSKSCPKLAVITEMAANAYGDGPINGVLF